MPENGAGFGLFRDRARGGMELDSESIDALGELIHVNLDSLSEFGKLSARIESPDCRNLCLEIASRRRDHVDLLLRHMHLFDNEVEKSIAPNEPNEIDERQQPERDVDFADPHERLAHAVNGEDVLEQCYERAYTKLSDTAFRQVLGAQYREVRRDHHRLAALSVRVAQRR
jgi:rubrerythrin